MFNHPLHEEIQKFLLVSNLKHSASALPLFPHPTHVGPSWALYLDGRSSVGLYSPSSRVPSSYKVLAMTRRNLSPVKRPEEQ